MMAATRCVHFSRCPSLFCVDVITRPALNYNVHTHPIFFFFLLMSEVSRCVLYTYNTAQHTDKLVGIYIYSVWLYTHLYQCTIYIYIKASSSSSSSLLAAGGKMAGSNKSTDLMKNANDVTEGASVQQTPHRES